MTDASERNTFYGFFGRAVISDDHANLRFYDYQFSMDPDGKPVFAVQFNKPRFGEDAVTQLVDCEVEVATFEDRAVITEIYGDRVAILCAASVSVIRAAYDTEDYAGRVRQLEAENTRLNTNLVTALGKNVEVKKLTIELLRRAEVKASASEHLRQNQAAAIAVLERLLAVCQNES